MRSSRRKRPFRSTQESEPLSAEEAAAYEPLRETLTAIERESVPAFEAISLWSLGVALRESRSAGATRDDQAEAAIDAFYHSLVAATPFPIDYPAVVGEADLLISGFRDQFVTGARAFADAPRGPAEMLVRCYTAAQGQLADNESYEDQLRGLWCWFLYALASGPGMSHSVAQFAMVEHLFAAWQPVLSEIGAAADVIREVQERFDAEIAGYVTKRDRRFSKSADFKQHLSQLAALRHARPFDFSTEILEDGTPAGGVVFSYSEQHIPTWAAMTAFQTQSLRWIQLLNKHNAELTRGSDWESLAEQLAPITSEVSPRR